MIELFAVRRAYYMAIGSILTFNFAMFLFAAIPLGPDPNPLLWEEITVAATSSVSFVGILLYSIGQRWWLPRWGFLISFFGIVLAMISIPTRSWLDDGVAPFPIPELILVLTFLWCGLFLTVGLHLEYGGKNPLRDQPLPPEE